MIVDRPMVTAFVAALALHGVLALWAVHVSAKPGVNVGRLEAPRLPYLAQARPLNVEPPNRQSPAVPQELPPVAAAQPLQPAAQLDQEAASAPRLGHRTAAGPRAPSKSPAASSKLNIGADLPTDGLGRPTAQGGNPTPGAGPGPIASGGSDVGRENGVDSGPYGMGTVDDLPQVERAQAPIYPERAERLHLQTVVHLRAVIRASGDVEAIQVSCAGCDPQFLEATQSAVSHWHFRPARLRGQTVAVRLEQEIEFTLPER